MRHWLKVAGTAAQPFVEDDWRKRRRFDGISMFPRRPAIVRGDRLVVYAAGSAARFGEGRFFALEEVTSEEPEPSGHERWRWKVHTHELVAVPLLSHAPMLSEINVIPRSLGRHSHIRLTPEQGERAEELLRRYAAELAERNSGPTLAFD